MSVAGRLRSPRRLSSLGETLPRAVLAVLCVAGFALIVILSTRLSFFNDDWYFLLQRPGAESRGGLDALLAPHNGNLVVVLAAAFKILVALFGMHPVWPFRAISGVSWAALGAVLYAYARPRVGPLVALLATGVVLFLGPAWEAMLFFSALVHVWAVTLGLASLILLERDTPARNAAACGLLTLGVGASTTGLGFAVGAAIAILTRRRPRQLWIVAVPVALFGLWWVGYGRGARTGVTGGHIAALPGYMFDALSSGLSTLLGLTHGRLPGVLSSGHLPAVIVLVALAVWLIRGRRASPQAFWVAWSLVAFWGLTGASAVPGRGAAASRYQVVDAVLILATASELLHGKRPARALAAGLVTVTIAVVVSNLIVLNTGYMRLRTTSGFVAADTGALQLAGPARTPDFQLVAGIAGDPSLSGITTGRYFVQTAAHGAPTFDSPAQLARAPVAQRAAADAVLIAAERVQPHLVSRAAPGPPCTTRTANPGARSSAVLPFGSSVIENRGREVLVLSISRFGPPATAHALAYLPRQSRVSLELAPDASAVRWHLIVYNPLRAPGAFVVCRG